MEFLSPVSLSLSQYLKLHVKVNGRIDPGQVPPDRCTQAPWAAWGPGQLLPRLGTTGGARPNLLSVLQNLVTGWVDRTSKACWEGRGAAVEGAGHGGGPVPVCRLAVLLVAEPAGMLSGDLHSCHCVVPEL